MAKKRKKSTVASPMMDMPKSDRQRMEVSVRKIKNGFLSSRSGHKPDAPYESEETFHLSKPKIEITVGERKARNKRLKKATF